MNKKLLAAILATAAIAFSCTVKDEPDALSSDALSSATATVEDFVLDGATKTILSATGNQVTIEFSDDDILNLYPVNPAGDGLPFKVLENKGSSCIFDGRERGFGLYEGTSYAAFYPGTGNGDVAPAANNVPVDFTGQWLWDFGATDFLYATGIEPKEKEGCKFTMKHLGALLPIKVTFDKATPITELSLTSDKTPFILSGTVDLTVNPVVILPGKTAKTVSMSLDPEAYTKASLEVFSVDAGEVVNFFMMIAPVDMTGSTIQVEVKNGKEVVASSEIEGKNFAAGIAYSVEVEESLGDPVDLSAEETANSYIVSEAGYYSIDATIAGNGNAVPWDKVSFASYAYPEYNATTGTVKRFTGNGVSVILNQNNCVSDVSYKDGKILFKATGNEGNAKLTLTNAGVGVWTWHIWCTDTPAVFAYDAGAYDLYHIMDRNMGAISDGSDNATCEEVSGLYYQYGNPLGYTFEDFYNQGYQGYEFNGRGIGTQQYALALNPNKPILNITPGEGKDFYWFDLWYDGVPDKIVYSKLWGGGSDIDGSLKYGDEVVKTLYDPCPAGYKIMGWDTFEELSTAETYSANYKGLLVPAEDGDIFIPYNGAAWPDAEDGTPMYMARGPYREVEGASIYATLWLSGHVGRNMAYFNNFSAKNANTAAYNRSPSSGHIIARGFGVRCMADEFDY